MLYSMQTMYLKCLQHITFTTMIRNTRNLSCGSFPGVSFPQLNQPEKKWQHTKLQRANFHSTQTLHLSVIGVTVTCAAANISSIIGGLLARRWWLSLTPEAQEKYRRWYQKRRSILYGSLSTFYLGLLTYYITHLQKDPLEKQRRFTMFNKDQLDVYGGALYQALLGKYNNQLVPTTDPIYARLRKVINNIGNSNKTILKDTVWTVTIVNDSNANTSAVSGGNIFVHSGIFNVIQNDDQLTFVLAHEMAHILLLHFEEIISIKILEEIIYTIPTFFIWANFSILKALILYVVSRALGKIFFFYPYTRARESEADKVGFELSARSCIDLREAVLFWACMDKYEEFTNKTKDMMPALSSHPNHISRQQKLLHQLPDALKLRDQAGCPDLPVMDPEKKLRHYIRNLEERYRHKHGFIVYF